MTSFLEKLKKGMGLETEPSLSEEVKTEIPQRKSDRQSLTTSEKNLELLPKKAEEKRKKPKKIEIKTKLLEPEKKEEETAKTFLRKGPDKEEKWFEGEGELAVDVYQTDKEIVIQAPIAGVKGEDLDITIENDILIIKGKRERPSLEEIKGYFYQECYWGAFSRKIVLPEETDPSRTEAHFKEGILTISIPKIERERKRKIAIKEE